MLECAKTHLQQSRISKFSGGGPPDPLFKGKEGEGGRRGRGKGREGGRGRIGKGGRGGKAIFINLLIHYLVNCKCQETTDNLKQMSHLTIIFNLIYHS